MSSKLLLEHNSQLEKLYWWLNIFQILSKYLTQYYLKQIKLVTVPFRPYYLR